MTEPAYASAAESNSAAILGVLRHEFDQCCSVLEIGSGTGQHAVAFAADLPWLNWQTSDLADTHTAIRTRIAEAGIKNVLPPMTLDVRSVKWSDQAFDAAYSCNTAHIMSEAAVARMIPLVGEVLSGGGIFCLYGPFRRHGQFNTPSNAMFHKTLRARDPAMGIRDLEFVDKLALAAGMVLQRIYAMPANNLLVTWKKQTMAECL